MQICLLTQSYPPVLGGLQTAVQALANGLVAQGHRVLVITNRYPRGLQAEEELEGVAVRRLLFLQPGWRNMKRGRLDLWLAAFYYAPTTQRRLAQLISTFSPDIVNIHYPDLQIPFLRKLLPERKFKMVVSTHGYEVARWFAEDRLETTKPADFVELQSLFRAAEAVTACSEALLKQAAQIERGVAAKGRVTYNGVDLARFADKSAYQYPRPYILAYGRLSYEKGFDLLLNAFAKVRSELGEADLILAGAGDESANLQALALDLGIGARVQFWGRATPKEVVQLLNGAALVVIPSRAETFGISALEAFAAGKRVVATNVGGLPEVVQEPLNKVVEPTVDGLVAGVRALWHMGQPDADENRNVAADFSWNKAVHRYLEVYEAVK